MPQSERLRVWKGELKKTSGGLRKQDLMKNKRGKIVSKKKSEAAKKNKENNLGQWLRSKGDQFLSKGLKQENIVRKNKPGRKAFKKKEEVPEEKQSEVKPTKPKPKPKPKPKKISKVRPTMVGDKPDNKSFIDVGNIKRKKRVRKPSRKAQENLDQRRARQAIDDYAAVALELTDFFTKEQIIKQMGEPPIGFVWPKS